MFYKWKTFDFYSSLCETRYSFCPGSDQVTQQ